MPSRVFNILSKSSLVSAVLRLQKALIAELLVLSNRAPPHYGDCRFDVRRTGGASARARAESLMS
jgi:hypothetical protein